jgi:hypothetical protein
MEEQYYKSGKAYSLESTEIPKVFFTPRHGRWRQQVPLLTTARKVSNAIMAFKVNVAMLSEVTVVIQQWPRFPLTQQCVPTMTQGHLGCLVPRKDATDRSTDRQT